jgi:CRISPR-associated protein Csd1
LSILASLVRANDRLAERDDAPAPGYARVPTGFMIALNEDGTTAGPPIDLRQMVGAEAKKRLIAPLMAVPQPPRRTRQIAPCFLWDKTAYALGVTAGPGKRTATEHARWREMHLAALAETADPGLSAFRRFIETWSTDQFETRGWPAAMLDQNVVFCLECERLDKTRIHDRPAAHALLGRRTAGALQSGAVCLVTGVVGPTARLHPVIKGVWNAQSSGATLVSYNAEASQSYGHEQGDNAPISEAAVAAYTAALNRMLERDSRNTVQVGDATVVFWADASDPQTAALAEGIVHDFLAGLPAIDKTSQATRAGAFRGSINASCSTGQSDPALAVGVRCKILGLSSNIARLSVRYWIDEEFGTIAANLKRHAEAMRISPPPRDKSPPLWRYLNETAALHKTIQPLLAGEWLRAIFNGAPYPRTLLAAVRSRIRADCNVNALRVAMLKAVLITQGQTGVPVALDPDNTEPGYVLGRLFAAYASIQRAALGSNVNVTVTDKFYNTASATPRAAFPSLTRLSNHHLNRLYSEKPGLATILQGRLGEIYNLSSPTGMYPATLSPAQQALFDIGYYHQRYSRVAESDEPIEDRV